LKTGKKVCSFS